MLKNRQEKNSQSIYRHWRRVEEKNSSVQTATLGVGLQKQKGPTDCEDRGAFKESLSVTISIQLERVEWDWN